MLLPSNFQTPSRYGTLLQEAVAVAVVGEVVAAPVAAPVAVPGAVPGSGSSGSRGSIGGTSSANSGAVGSGAPSGGKPSWASRGPVTSPSGPLGSYTNPLLIYLLATGYYPGGSLRQNGNCHHDQCSGQSEKGDAVDCNTDGSWLPITAQNITAACTQLNATGTDTEWLQTTNNDGSPLLDAKGGTDSILWSVQYNGATNGGIYCETALRAIATACQGTNPDIQGGGWTAADTSVHYGVDPKSDSCKC